MRYVPDLASNLITADSFQPEICLVLCILQRRFTCHKRMITDAVVAVP
jgi:hypothetical protein